MQLCGGTSEVTGNPDAGSSWGVTRQNLIFSSWVVVKVIIYLRMAHIFHGLADLNTGSGRLRKRYPVGVATRFLPYVDSG